MTSGASPGRAARPVPTGRPYPLTPDRDFVLGPLPGHDRVLVAPGAADGFTFAPWFGPRSPLIGGG